MGIKDLPRPGINFRATAGAGNFQRKLSGATRYGDLKNLRDNQKAIVEAVKKYQGVIRTKGGLSRLQQRSAWFKIKASDKTVTKEDRREIKQVLKHLSRGAAAGAKAAAGGKPVKASDGKSRLTEEQIQRNLKARLQLDDYGIRKRQLHETRYAGGTVQSTSLGAITNNSTSGGGRVKGTMADLNIKRGTTGFAKQFNEKKAADKPAPQAPSGGTRPLGL